MASPSRKRKRETVRTSVAEPEGFGSLSKSQQIRYLQALWDRISDGPGELPAPKSHLILARERLREYRRDPARARPAHDVLDDLAHPGR